jgi:nucleoside-diphosphate-sugar epimerase
MPYCLSCKNHFETIEEMEWIDCNRMGLCKGCGNVKETKTIMITGKNKGYIASNLLKYVDQREGITAWLQRRDLFHKEFFGIDELPDAVIHLAAMSGVVPCERNPREALLTNVFGTIRVIEECEQRGIPVWLASSFAAIQPENVYGYTKQFAEYLTLRYSLGRVFVISNVYGGLNFESKTSVLSAWMKVMMMGLPIVITGDGTQERDFVHVQDVVRTMIDQVNVELRGGPSYDKYYICSGVKTSLNELYDLFESEFDPKVQIKYEPNAPTGIKNPYIIPPLPHCTPRISLRNGIHRLKEKYVTYDL